jgi:hypothetical protein
VDTFWKQRRKSIVHYNPDSLKMLNKIKLELGSKRKFLAGNKKVNLSPPIRIIEKKISEKFNNTTVDTNCLPKKTIMMQNNAKTNSV